MGATDKLVGFVTVRRADDLSPMQGATVDVRFRYPNGNEFIRSELTDSTGRANPRIFNLPTGVIEVCRIRVTPGPSDSAYQVLETEDCANIAIGIITETMSDAVTESNTASQSQSQSQSNSAPQTQSESQSSDVTESETESETASVHTNSASQSGQAVTESQTTSESATITESASQSSRQLVVSSFTVAYKAATDRFVATATVTDGAGVPQSTAAVTVTFTSSGDGVALSKTETTDVAGTAVVRRSGVPTGIPYEVCVDSITKPGYVFTGVPPSCVSFTAGQIA